MKGKERMSVTGSDATPIVGGRFPPPEA